jgi:transposase
LGIPKGYKVLFLPVHHPELNPIEYVWAIVKNECGRLLRSGVKFKDVKENLKKAFEKISPETCRKLYEKVIIKEEEYWNLDEQLDCIE